MEEVIVSGISGKDNFSEEIITSGGVLVFGHDLSEEFKDSVIESGGEFIRIEARHEIGGKIFPTEGEFVFSHGKDTFSEQFFFFLSLLNPDLDNSVLYFNMHLGKFNILKTWLCLRENYKKGR